MIFSWGCSAKLTKIYDIIWTIMLFSVVLIKWGKSIDKNVTGFLFLVREAEILHSK
jgi:hypothetical protein